MAGLDKTPLKEIGMPTINEDDEDVRVQDCTYIGSYNWIKGDTPTILVPGMVSTTIKDFKLTTIP